jgi:hypothetical protein
LERLEPLNRFKPFDLAPDRLRESFDELKDERKFGTAHGELVEPLNVLNGWNKLRFAPCSGSTVV